MSQLTAQVTEQATAQAQTEMQEILNSSMSTPITNQELGERLGENRKRILELMKENRHITIPELSEKLGISTTAVEKNIKYLRENKLIERIGPAKGGSWGVSE